MVLCHDDVSERDEGALESQDMDIRADNPEEFLADQEPLMNSEYQNHSLQGGKRLGIPELEDSADQGATRDSNTKITRFIKPIVFGVMLVTAVLTFIGMQMLRKGRGYTYMQGEEGIIQLEYANTIVPSDDEHVPLCDKDVVANACAVMNRETQEYYGNALDADLTVVHRAEIMQLFMSPLRTVITLISKIGVKNISPIGSRAAFKCQDLCVQLVKSMPPGTLPKVTNMACMVKESGALSKETECNIDVSPHVLKSIKFPESEDDHWKGFEIPILKSANTTKEPNFLRPEIGWEDLRMRLLHLFKIFPATGQAVHVHERRLFTETDWGNYDPQETVRLVQISKAYTIHALEKMANLSVPHVVNLYYGNNNPSTRKEIKRLLNGALAFFDEEVEWRYPGWRCHGYGRYCLHGHCYESDQPAGVVGYVETNDYWRLNAQGHPIINLCKAYTTKSEGYKIETILHEATHHRDMDTIDSFYPPLFGNDVLYTRPRTQGTAEACCDFSGAPLACGAVLENAESFAFFVFDAFHLEPSTSDAAKTCCGTDCENPDSYIARLSGSR